MPDAILREGLASGARPTRLSPICHPFYCATASFRKAKSSFSSDMERSVSQSSPGDIVNGYPFVLAWSTADSVFA